ncbi:MAG: FAD-binding protein [Sphingomonadaceae bacterium]|nr:FAD-binding protein [Sphingomonadaceae bacterium]
MALHSGRSWPLGRPRPAGISVSAMRRTDPIIIGAGPAGCAAAITLARGNRPALILERDTEVGDALCGGFVSWRTMATLKRLGIEITGHPITQLRVFAGTQVAEAPLPQMGHGLSRRAMDSALVAQAIASGAGIERGVAVRHIESVRAQSSALFLATGKHDVKGTRGVIQQHSCSKLRQTTLILARAWQLLMRGPASMPSPMCLMAGTRNTTQTGFTDWETNVL